MDIKRLERFRELIPTVDNIGQVISAEDINVLREIALELQREAFRQQDEDFLRMAIDTFEHHPDVNAMWLELLPDGSKIDMNNSLGIEYSEDERSVVLKPGSFRGFVTSKGYKPSSGCNIKKVLLFVDYFANQGDEVVFEVSNNGLDFQTVEANSGRLVELKTDGSWLYFRARLARTTEGAGPRIYAWAILYFDSTIAVDLDRKPDVAIDYEDLELPPPPQPPEIKPQLKHSELLEIGPDDHHPKIHRHSGEPGENDKIDLVSEVKNILWWEHLPAELLPGIGHIRLLRDPAQDDRVVRVEGERFSADLMYNGERLQEVFVQHFADGAIQSSVKTVLDWQEYTFADGTTDTVVAGVDIQRVEVR